MSPPGFIDSHAHATAAADEIASTAAARLPGDVLAAILLRLPASDLRRFRRVCKEWRDAISDPIFIDAHQVQGPRGPTHTIVFLGSERRTGRGFLFDEHWRLTATFAADKSESMVGTCKGLLCFLDVAHGAISVVEPFTGESLALPLPPETAKRRLEGAAYCFGFDPNTRQYKIVHKGYGKHSAKEQVLLHVYTVGGSGKWRSLHVAGVEPSHSEGEPVCVGGSVYWWVVGTAPARQEKFVRFDLATEEVTTNSIQKSQQISLVESEAWMYLAGYRWRGVLKALFVRESDCSVYMYNGHAVKLPHGRLPTELQALQRGHLLLDDYGEYGLYAHPVEQTGHDLGSGKLLLKIFIMMEDEPVKNADLKTSRSRRGLFVPVPFNQEPVPVRHVNSRAKTFGYVPPVSPAQLAHYLSGFRSEEQGTENPSKFRYRMMSFLKGIICS